MRVNYEQLSDNWFGWRKGKISASMMPAVMGVSPWKSRNRLWKEILGIVPQPEMNHHMRRGQEMEPIVREMVRERALIHFEPACFEKKDEPWAIASLDGIDPWEEVILEIKCPSKRTEGVPEHYLPQIQWCLYVTGVKKCIYATFTDDVLDIYEVLRDDEYIEKLRKEALIFREQVRNLEEPEDNKPVLAEITCPESLYRLDRYNELCAQIEELETQRTALRETIIEDAKGQACKGGGFRITPVEREGAVDYSKIPELKGIKLDDFRKPKSVYWTIKKDKI